mmetsp:Transcript_71642/g.119834  ORF Transcript_71642/g.119834 Transcript_71642/m.119834 type:complete len:109 (+) Transcript_71642:1384-1710(+)
MKDTTTQASYNVPTSWQSQKHTNAQSPQDQPMDAHWHSVRAALMPVSENPKHLLCMVCSENIFRAASSIDTRLACPGMAYNGHCSNGDEPEDSIAPTGQVEHNQSPKR